MNECTRRLTFAALLAGGIPLAPCAATPAGASTDASAAAATPQRQAEVRAAGAHVMPFSLDRTLHTFDKTDSGGVQRVHVRGDAPDQVAMIRSHLRSIAASFTQRDFSAPMHIHGAAMPGLAELKAAAPGELTVTYRDTDDGGEIDYDGHTPQVVAAIHRWFDAQLADHGHDATTSTAQGKP